MKLKRDNRTKKKKRNNKSKSHKSPSSIKGLRATLKNYKKIQKEYNIKDVPFSKAVSKGTEASCNHFDYHYQNYSNVMDFFKIINNSNVSFFKKGDAFLNLNISNMKEGLYPINKDLKSFITNLRTCIKNKKRFIPVILNLITDEGAHANILLINKKNKTIELYEPHGSRVSSSILGGVVGAYKKKIYEIRKFFRSILPKFKVVNVVDYRSGTAFQMARDPSHHSGFCVTWTILFSHYRLLNPNLSLSVLINYISMKVTTLKLLQYARYIEDNKKEKI